MTDPVATALEQHAQSLRELARALVGPAHAEDVVQATAEAALRGGPVRQPLAFLRHVLRMQAHRHHRDTARRRQRESAHAAARDTTSPAAEHALEQQEAVAQLHEALMLVPQPHLGALLLRYFEDLSPPAIAERLAVPLPTIKSRLQRGLELLRAELDRRAPRDQWQPRLATAFALPQAALVRTGATALLAISTMKLVAAVSFVGLATTAWLLWPTNDVSPPAAPAVAANDAPPAKAAEGTAQPTAPPTERTAVAGAPAANVARLVGRVTTADGSPLPGATITVVPPVGGDPPPVARAATDGDGAFACEPPPGEYVVRVAASPHVGLQSDARAFAAGGLTDLGTIVVRRGVVVGGRVVDRDGNAIVGTLIGTGTAGQQASAPTGWWWCRATPRTDANGRFTLGPILPADYQLTTPQEQLLAPVLLQLAEGQADVELELRVESASRQATLRGRVVDEGGSGIVGATVTATERVDFRNSLFVATSGDDGAFSMRRLLTSAPQPVPVRATAPGFDETVLDDRVDWSRSDLTIVLRPLAALIVRVVDGDGTPVTQYTVRIGPLRPAGPGVAWHTGHFTVVAAAGANGEHTIRDLNRGLYDVHVTPTGERLAVSCVERIELTGALQHQTIVLQPRVRRVVHLRAPDGAPIAGANVELCQPCLGAIDLQSYVVTLDRWTYVHMPAKSLWLQSGTSDATGEVVLDGPAATALVLRVPGPGCVPFVVAIPRLDGDGPLVVACKRGGTLRVSAQPLDVIAALDALRNVQREEPRLNVWLQREVGKARERVPSSGDDARTFDASGVATVDGVPDGTWVPRIAVGREEIMLPATAIAEGTTSDLTVDLAPLRPVTLRGRVVADSPVAGRNVNVERQRGAFEANPGRWDTVGGTGLMLDEAGAFVLHTLPGRFRVLLLKQRTDDYGAELLAQPAGVDVAPGASCEQTFTVATGSVLLRFVDRGQRPVAGVLGAQLYRADGMFLANMPPSDDSGRARVDLIETGRNKLVVLPRRFGAAKTAIGKLYADHPNEPDIVERTQLDLGPIVVATGDPVEQTFVLPDAWFR